MLISPGRTRERTNLKWTFIRDKKPSAIAAAVPTVIAFVVAITVVVTIGVFLTATGCTLAAIRRRSRRKHLPPLNWTRVASTSKSVQQS